MGTDGHTSLTFCFLFFFLFFFLFLNFEYGDNRKTGNGRQGRKTYKNQQVRSLPEIWRPVRASGDVRSRLRLNYLIFAQTKRNHEGQRAIRSLYQAEEGLCEISLLQIRKLEYNLRQHSNQSFRRMGEDSRCEAGEEGQSRGGKKERTPKKSRPRVQKMGRFP